MPKNKRYHFCSMAVVQGQLSCKAIPDDHCCPHGRFGKDQEEKSKLISNLIRLSEHFWENREFLVPSLNKGFTATKNGLVHWGSELWRFDRQLHDVLACDLSGKENRQVVRANNDFFLSMVTFVACYPCGELSRIGQSSISTIAGVPPEMAGVLQAENPQQREASSYGERSLSLALGREMDLATKKRRLSLLSMAFTCWLSEVLGRSVSIG